jgi:NAD-dependent SIR2 family protein deacetylase
MPLNDFQKAAKLIAEADGLLITAGAGMGVDSGLPDFRGNAGFWKAYPALGQAGIEFTKIANPAAFAREPRLAWGFYGHRLALYRRTVPHAGFDLLQQMAAQLRHGAFVITSNVDGQFQKAGFNPAQVLEIHGSIHHLQCAGPCGDTIWSAETLMVEIDEVDCQWTAPELPTCPRCGSLARPNILMFGDWDWIADRQHQQQRAWQQWVNQVNRLVVVEMGAGVDIASIREISESQGCPLIRINPRHPDLGRAAGISLPMGARAGLEAIWAELQHRK